MGKIIAAEKYGKRRLTRDSRYFFLKSPYKGFLDTHKIIKLSQKMYSLWQTQDPDTK